MDHHTAGDVVLAIGEMLIYIGFALCVAIIAFNDRRRP